MHASDRADPQQLPDGLGITVFGTDVSELAGALRVLADLLAGRRPPAGVAQPRVTARLIKLQEAFATAAREQQAVRHRQAARVSQEKLKIIHECLAPAKLGGSSSTATLTSQQAADQLGVTVQRVTGLCRSGALSAKQGARLTWLIDPHSVAAYRARQAHRRRTSDRSGSTGPTAR